MLDFIKNMIDFLKFVLIIDDFNIPTNPTFTSHIPYQFLFLNNLIQHNKTVNTNNKILDLSTTKNFRIAVEKYNSCSFQKCLSSFTDG